MDLHPLQKTVLIVTIVSMVVGTAIAAAKFFLIDLPARPQEPPAIEQGWEPLKN